MTTIRSRRSSLTDTTARLFTELIQDCRAVGVDTSDIANCALPLLRSGDLTEAQARAHVQVLKHRLWGQS